MDLNTLIIGIVCLAIVVVPFLYFQINQNKKNQKVHADFIDVAEKQQLDISLSDFWDPSYAIGIDTDNLKLLYIKKNDGKDQQTIIDLSKVSRCGVNKLSRETDGSKVIDRIELVFTYRDHAYTVKSLEFYNRDENLILGHELNLCERWSTVINSSLTEASTRTPVLN